MLGALIFAGVFLFLAFIFPSGTEPETHAHSQDYNCCGDWTNDIL